MSKPRNPFDEFISAEIAPLLKARGFRRRDRQFTRRVGGNYQFIDLGGRGSTHYDFKRGVALGVYYGAMREFDEFPTREDLLKEYHGHWRSVWMWQPITFGPDLRSWLESEGLPLLDRLADDSRAMESWRAGPVDGLSETKRLQWLAIGYGASWGICGTRGNPRQAP